MRSVRSGDRVERCRLGAAPDVPFECPEGCLFYESRSTSSAGWQIGSWSDDDPERGSGRA